VGWVELLLRDTVARCRFNGWDTRQFRVTSGVAQGSPLSPLLYLIAAQPLAALMRRLQRTGRIAAIPLPDGAAAPPTYQHADDTTVHVASMQDLRVAWEEGIVPFCRASASQANPSKTQAMLLGSASEACEEGCVDSATGVKVVPRSEAVRHLGVMLGAGEVGKQARARVFEAKVEGVGASIRHWARFGLSDHGRALIAKQILASKVVYHATFDMPQRHIMQRLDSMVMQFVAGDGGRMHPRREVAQLPWESGGRAVVCIPEVVRALQAGIIARHMHPQWQPWKGLMGQWLGRSHLWLQHRHRACKSTTNIAF
jgi:hypothetical protein